MRRSDGTYVVATDSDVRVLLRALAFEGINALEVPEVEPIANDLRVRRVPLGEASAVVLRRRLAMFRSPSPAAIERCRLLLLGQEALLRWRRCPAGRERTTFITARALAKWAFA